MNEKIIEELLLYMEKTKDFVLNEYPEIIWQIFLYEKFSNLITFVFSALCFIICAIAFIYFIRNPILDKYDNWTLVCLYCVMGSGLGGFIFITTLINSADKLIKLYLAPKYYLVDLILGMKK